MTRFTAQQRHEILRNYLGGVSSGRLGRKYKCHPAYVRALKHRYAPGRERRESK